MEMCKEPASSSVGSLQGLEASEENEAVPPSIRGSLVSARASVSVAVTMHMAVTMVESPSCSLWPRSICTGEKSDGDACQ